MRRGKREGCREHWPFSDDWSCRTWPASGRLSPQGLAATQSQALPTPRWWPTQKYLGSAWEHGQLLTLPQSQRPCPDPCLQQSICQEGKTGNKGMCCTIAKSKSATSIQQNLTDVGCSMAYIHWVPRWYAAKVACVNHFGPSQERIPNISVSSMFLFNDQRYKHGIELQGQIIDHQMGSKPRALLASRRSTTTFAFSRVRSCKNNNMVRNHECSCHNDHFLWT